MAVPANTSKTIDIRYREDLSKMMAMISPTETVFQNMIGTEDCEARIPEWSTEAIRASDAENAAIEGDDVTNDPQQVPVIVKNHVQTYDETIGVSDLMSKVVTIDHRKEMARQLASAGYALKLDQEKRLCGNYASIAMTASVAGKHAGALAVISTNANTGGATGGGYNSGTGLTGAWTGGTPRALTHALFKTTVQNSYVNGRGGLTNVLCGPTQKVVISGFTGVVQSTNEVSKEKVTVLGAVDVVRTDFGFHTIACSREMANDAVLILTPSTWKKLILDGYNIKDLASNGHSSRKLLRTTITLKCTDERRNASLLKLS